MNEEKKAPKKRPAKPGDGQTYFRVKHMRGFKPGERIVVDKKRAEGWEKKGYGQAVTK